MNGAREAAINALLAIITNAHSWAIPPSRRLKLWSDTPPEQRPCAFLFEGDRETYSWANMGLSKRALEVRLFVYIDAKDPATIGAAALNQIMDAIDAALQPSGADINTGKNTLAGAADYCRIEGEPFKDPGDLDGDGLLIVPIKIVLP